MAERTLLVIILGNARWKWGWGVRGEMMETAAGAYPFPEELPRADRALVLSVVPPQTSAVVQRLVQRGTRVWTGKDVRPRLPVCYTHPEQLGEDRLALVAFGMQQPRPSVILDAGTALTVNVIHPHRGLLGGAILPGMDLAFRALHTGTAALPAVDPAPPPSDARGCSTEEALRVGVVEGLARGAHALGKRMIAHMGEKEVSWWLTGGRADLLRPYIPEAHVDPTLALKGAFGLLEKMEENPT